MLPADNSDAGRLRVAVSYGTRTGHLNELNEDSLLKERLADGTWVFAVADGIGGYEGGEVASALAVTCLREVMAATGEPLAPRLARAVEEANRRIVGLQQARGPELRAMGTTLTALALDPATGDAAAAHVGDSRLCRLDGEGLTALTEDHNVGTELVREGLLAPEELSHHPQRNVLTRALGAAPEVHPDVFTFRVAAGEAYVLMTDGMVDAVASSEVATLAGQTPTWAEVGPRLAALAEARQNDDDATVVAVRLEGASEAGA